MGWWNSGLVRPWDSETVGDRAVGLPLSAFCWPFPAVRYSRWGPRLSAWRGDSLALPRRLKVVFAFAQGGLIPAISCRLPAYRCRLSAIYFPPPTSHPERQRRISVPAVSDTYADKYQSAGRHQTIRQSDIRKRYSRKQGGSGAFGARVQGLAGAAPLEASGSAHRAGWFRGEYCMPPSAAIELRRSRHHNPLNLLNLVNLVNPLNPGHAVAP